MNSSTLNFNFEQDLMNPFNLGKSQQVNSNQDSNEELISPATQFSDVSAYDYNMDCLESIPFVPIQRGDSNTDSESSKMNFTNHLSSTQDLIQLPLNIQSNAGFNPFAGWSEPEDSSKPKNVKKEEELTNTYEIKVESTKTCNTFNGWVDSEVSLLAKLTAKPENMYARQDSMTKSTQLSTSNNSSTDESNKSASNDENDMDCEDDVKSQASFAISQVSLGSRSKKIKKMASGSDDDVFSNSSSDSKCKHKERPSRNYIYDLGNQLIKHAAAKLEKERQQLVDEEVCEKGSEVDAWIRKLKTLTKKVRTLNNINDFLVSKKSSKNVYEIRKKDWMFQFAIEFLEESANKWILESNLKYKNDYLKISMNVLRQLQENQKITHLI